MRAKPTTSGAEAQGLTRTLDEATLLTIGLLSPTGLGESERKKPSASQISTQLSLRSKAMKLKLDGKVREVSERRQVGDAEEMLGADKTKGAWWRNVGMEERS